MYDLDLDLDLEKINFNEMIKLKINKLTPLKILILFVDWCEFYRMYNKVGNRYYLAKKLIREKE